MDKRPVYLNLLKIRLPVTGMVSIAHRFSGILLFLSIPFAVYLLDLSVSRQSSYAEVMNMLAQPWMLLVQIILLWSLVHHLIAGIRFLLIDAELGIELGQARLGAWLVFLADALVLLVIVCWVGL